jgi:hypothetical protein
MFLRRAARIISAFLFILLLYAGVHADSGVPRSSIASSDLGVQPVYADVVTQSASADDRPSLAPAYDIEPAPVHQWMALQAFKKLSTFPGLIQEIQNYLPTDENSWYYSGDYHGGSFNPPFGWNLHTNEPFEQPTALIEGVWEEDKGEFIPFTDLPTRSFVHFWNPEGEFWEGIDLSYLGIGVQNSALQAAQERLGNAVTYYLAGDKTMAYYWLGRTAHLVQDLSVPAHVQLDQHATDQDMYEQFTASYESHYEHTTSNSDNTAIPPFWDPPGSDYPRNTPTDFNDDLTNLLYSLAHFADEFDSDDVSGRTSTYGHGRFRNGNNDLNASKTFDRAYLVSPLPWADEIRLLDPVYEYFVVDCSWCNYASIHYLGSLRDMLDDSYVGVKACYTDGSYDLLYSPEYDHVSWAVCGELYQPQLEARAIGYTAALYELFWFLVNPQYLMSGNVFSLVGDTRFPLEGVILKLWKDGDELFDVDTTDVEGSYAFEPISPGSYCVDVDDYYGCVYSFDSGLFDTLSSPSLAGMNIDYSTGTNADNGDPLRPDRLFTLHQNYPNPFNPITRIEFSLKRRSDVIFDVFNILGERVRQIANGSFDVGHHEVTWDGTDDDHTPVPSGVYFYRLTSGRQSESKKMVLLK